MIPQNIQQQIISIWDKYIADNKIVLYTKGNDLQDIDKERLEWTKSPQNILSDFIEGEISLAEFKYHIDSFNKEHNLWGFPSIKEKQRPAKHACNHQIPRNGNQNMATL